jgi:hypothetical protein
MAQTKTAPSPARRRAATKPSGRGSRPTAARRKAAPSKTAGGGPASRPSALETARSSVTVKLPLVTVQVRAPHVPRVRPIGVGRAVSSVQSSLPPPERMAYYAGLGALAMFGVIEWPVAAAIGAGTILAKRALKKDGPRGTDRGARPGAARPA